MKFTLLFIVCFPLLSNTKGSFANNDSDIRIQPRITGGNEAQPHQFPYQVGLAIQLNLFLSSWCGGSLISDEFVLTAAHCTEEAQSIIVYLGAHNIDDLQDGSLKIRLNRKSIIVHKDYDTSNLKNDISLIRLPYKIKFTDTIQPVNLPSRSQVSMNFDGKSVIASGWGRISDKKSDEGVSSVLRFIQVPVLPKWRSNIRYLGMISNELICAKASDRKSTCSGDSGGPLVYTDENGTKTVLGVTSFGLSWGCEIGWPGVFTKVSSYLDWIEEHSNIKIRNE